jgi:hypothetical protein
MTDYEEGARVEVYDPDHGRWCPGTVEGITQTSMGSITVVKSDDLFEHDLPLLWAVPVRAVDTLVRPLVVSP